MKTIFKTMLALLAGAMVFPACTRELAGNLFDEQPDLSGLKTMTFTAVQESQEGATKATIDSRDIKWSTGDALSVFDGIGNQVFSLDGEGGSTSGSFTGSAATASTYFAIYPYTEGASLRDSKIISAVLPTLQTATAGSADPAAMLMMATSTDASTLSFKNVCAYVKVTPAFDCSGIELISKGSENLAGTVNLDYNDGVPVAEVTANGTNYVSLTGTITSGSTYYIAVLPASLESGFDVMFQIDGEYYKKGTNKVLGLSRNKVMDLGSFSTSDLSPVDSDGFTIFTTAISGDEDSDSGYGIAW